MKTKITILIYLLLSSTGLTFAQPGTLDNTFGFGGKVITQVGSQLNPGWAYATAIQADGKIVVVGEFYGSKSYPDFFVVRYNSSGLLDHTFANNGVADLDLGDLSNATCIAIQKDGKIVVAGLKLAGSDEVVAIVRLNSNGLPDYTFGFLGEVITDLGGVNDLVYSVAIQNDGKIVVAGTTNNNNGKDQFFVVRYYGNGDLDNTFNGNGKVFTLIGTQLCRARSVAIQTDGKIVVAGFYKAGSTPGYNFAVARYNTNGTLDNTFGPDANGKTGIDFGGADDYGWSVAIQTDGKIVVAGHSGGLFEVTKLSTGGKRIGNFGVNGKVTTLVGNSSLGRSLAIQTNGKIVVSGRALVGNANWDFGLVRYNADGSLDGNFGTNGIVTTGFGHQDYGDAVAIQQDGKIVVVGTTELMQGDKIAIARYNGDPVSLPATDENISAATDKKLSNSPTIKLFSNPAKDVLSIDGMDASSTNTISIVDINGRIVQTTTTGNGTHTCNIASLPAGTYYLLIDDKKKKTSLRFVKE